MTKRARVDDLHVSQGEVGDAEYWARLADADARTSEGAPHALYLDTVRFR